jgi:hypothetical protein
MKATESEAYQEKIQARAEHCNGVQCIKAMHVPTALQDRVSEVLDWSP